MQFKGPIGAIILELVLIGGIPFRGHDDAFDLFQYVGMNLSCVLNGISCNMENRLIELHKSLAAPIDPSICH